LNKKEIYIAKLSRKRQFFGSQKTMFP